MDICVIIPCYNEEKTILQVINEVHTALPQAHICVFDNNSSDDSPNLVKAKIASLCNTASKTPMGGGKTNQNLALILVCDILPIHIPTLSLLKRHHTHHLKTQILALATLSYFSYLLKAKAR